MPHNSHGLQFSDADWKSGQNSNGVTLDGVAKRRWGRLKLAIFDK